MDLPETPLPKSASGRTPKWVVDDAAGNTPEDTSWRAPEESLIPDSGPLKPQADGDKPKMFRKSFIILISVAAVAAIVLGVVAGAIIASGQPPQ